MSFKSWMGKHGCSFGAVGLLFLGACTANRPVVYPGQQVQDAGNAAVQSDIDDCIARAKEYEASGFRGGEVARRSAERAAVGAGIGAAAGAAGGAVHGNAGRGAAAGAAGGAAGGLVSGIFDAFRKRDPDPVYKNFVVRCMSEKGYEIIGWE